MAAPNSEIVKWWRPSDIRGVEVLWAERCTRRWRVYHDTYTICTIFDISDGETEWTYRGKNYSSKAHGLMLMEPGEVHAMPHTIPPCDFRVLLLSPWLVEKAASELDMATPRPHLKVGHLSDPELFRTFARFHAALETASSQLERDSHLATCIRLLFAQCTETGLRGFKQPARSALLRARDLIRNYSSRPIKLDELVAATELSRYHLVRAFAKEFGLPPHAYQTNVQIAKARALLRTGFPAADVAAEIGFADQSHFTRHFKRVYGVTPGAYVGKNNR